MSSWRHSTPFGHARGPAGVDAVEVVRRPRREVAPVGGGRQGATRSRRRVPTLPRAVADLEQRPALGHRRQGVADRRGEAAVEDEADEPGVLVEIAKLRGDVAVIDVDGNGADLEAGEHPLEVLGPVGQLQADPVAAADAGAGEMVRQAVGPTVELRRR